MACGRFIATLFHFQQWENLETSSYWILKLKIDVKQRNSLSFPFIVPIFLEYLQKSWGICVINVVLNNRSLKNWKLQSNLYLPRILFQSVFIIKPKKLNFLKLRKFTNLKMTNNIIIALTVHIILHWKMREYSTLYILKIKHPLSSKTSDWRSLMAWTSNMWSVGRN